MSDIFLSDDLRLQLTRFCFFYSKVGLSATPGKDIENVKEVIRNLKISKIEARSETDPEVQKHTHSKEREKIIIEPTSQMNSVQTKFGKLLGPLIDELRQRNGIRNFRGSNSTITSYNVFLSRQQVNGNGDHSMDSMYSVIQELLKAREGLRENGIGFARSKLKKFLFEGNKNGYKQSVLQSNAFLDLYDMVTKSQNIGDETPTTEQIKENNPKLSKLEEILLEHFERSRAMNRSSRAIVYSQWRDSVVEIVDVLKSSMPLVKPQKFVGQASGSSSGTTKDSKSTLKGMNQKEQQRVIGEFSAGIHNVLVCTW